MDNPEKQAKLGKYLSPFVFTLLDAVIYTRTSDLGNLSRFWLSFLYPLILLLPMIWFTNHSILGVPGEG